MSQLDAEDIEIDTFSANLYDLLSAFQKVLAQTGRTQMHEVFEQVVSLEEKISEIQERLDKKSRMLFSELFEARWSRNLLIVTFLAVLEIVRSRYARILQDKTFGEIVIELTQTDAPQEPAAEGASSETVL